MKPLQLNRFKLKIPSLCHVTNRLPCTEYFNCMEYFNQMENFNYTNYATMILMPGVLLIFQIAINVTYHASHSMRISHRTHFPKYTTLHSGNQSCETHSITKIISILLNSGTKLNPVLYRNTSAAPYTNIYFNSLTPKTSLEILLTVCYTVLVMLVWKIWY